MMRREVQMAQRANIAIREARKRKALTDLEVKEGLRLTRADLETLDEIRARPGRNAMAQLGALKLKMLATVEPARAVVGVEQTVTVVVKTLGPTVEVKALGGGGEEADEG